jgi:hypothetical protein
LRESDLTKDKLQKNGKKVEKLEEGEKKNRKWGRGKLLRPRAAQRVVTTPQGRALGTLTRRKTGMTKWMVLIGL